MTSRREVAKTEKYLNDNLLSTAKAEKKAKEDIWKMKKETAEYERVREIPDAVRSPFLARESERLKHSEQKRDAIACLFFM